MKASLQRSQRGPSAVFNLVHFRQLLPGTIDFRVERLQLFLASTDIVRHDIGIWRPNSMEPWQTASTLSLMQHEGVPENRLRIRPFSGRLPTRNNTVKT